MNRPSTILPTLGALLFALSAQASSDPETVPLEPPEGFAPLAAPIFGGSGALVPLIAPGSRREAVAAWVDLSRGASLLLGKVQAPFDPGPEPADAIASAIAGHLRTELELEAVVAAASPHAGPQRSRWEAQAATRAAGGERTLRFAFYPAGRVHYVLAASYPPAQQEALGPRIDRTFQQFSPRVEREEKQTALIAGACAVALCLMAGAVVWRRRRAAATQR